jgi:hypothetical protein
MRLTTLVRLKPYHAHPLVRLKPYHHTKPYRT